MTALLRRVDSFPMYRILQTRLIGQRHLLARPFAARATDLGQADVTSSLLCPFQLPECLFILFFGVHVATLLRHRCCCCFFARRCVLSTSLKRCFRLSCVFGVPVAMFFFVCVRNGSRSGTATSPSSGRNGPSAHPLGPSRAAR